jgi:hypothetical protein
MNATAASRQNLMSRHVRRRSPIDRYLVKLIVDCLSEQPEILPDSVAHSREDASVIADAGLSICQKEAVAHVAIQANARPFEIASTWSSRP